MSSKKENNPSEYISDEALEANRQKLQAALLEAPIVHLPASLIQVADEYQRTLRTSAVNKMRRNFRPSAYKTLDVGQRADDSLWCIDGFTRLTVARLLGLQLVPCRLHKTSGPEEEAQLFRLLNEQRNQTSLHKFKAAIAAGEPEATAVRDITEAHGFRLAFSNERTWPWIRSVKTLTTAYRGQVLNTVLGVVNQAWSETRDHNALNTPMLGGLSRLFMDYGGLIDAHELATRLKYKSVAMLLAACESRKMQNESREIAMCEMLISVWNKGRRKRIKLGVGK